MLYRRILICLSWLLLAQLTFGFQLGYFYPERHAEVIQLGDSILQLPERKRPEHLDVKGYTKMPVNRLLAEYNLRIAASHIDSATHDQGIIYARKAVELSEYLDDEELKLVALVTAGRLEKSRRNYKEALLYYNQAKGLNAPKHQQIYLLWNLKQVLTKSQKSNDGFGLQKNKEMLQLAQGMETEALRLWYVYIAQALAANHRARGEYDLTKSWFEKGAKAAEKLPASELAARIRLAMVYSGFLVKIKDYKGTLEVLLNTHDLIQENKRVADRGIYLRRWLRVLEEAPTEFLEANGDQFLYSSGELAAIFKDESSRIGTSGRIKGLSDLIYYESLKENWQSVAEMYEQLRELETGKQVDELKDLFNTRNELLRTSAATREALQQEQLQRAKANQRLYVAAILLVLVIGFFIYRNAIQRKRQNQALYEKNQLILQQKQDIEQINELKSKFFTNISHELRTPLTLAMGNLKNVISGNYGALNERQSKSLAVASANARRIMGLVKDMLDLSKIESGKEKINVRKLNLESECHAVLNLFDVQFEEKELEVEVQVAGEMEGIYLDPLKLETILFNLVSNAVKHSYPKSVLTLEIREEDNQQILSICNRGDGIPGSEIPYVFDRFFQAGSTRSGEGSGVGLSLTKELTALHQAEISVTSTPNELTCFTLRFLKGTSHFTSEQVTEEPESGFDPVIINQGTKVLVVEDNADMRHYLYELLSEKFKVSLAENGQDALNRIETINPDLVITDYMMPEMNGVKFYRALRKLDDFNDVPVVFLTARAIERDRESLLKEGVDDYILKPFEDTDLFRRIGHLLSLKGERTRHRTIATRPVEEMENKFLNLLRATVFASIQDTDLNPTTLADALSVSERTLYRKVKAATGFAPQAYIKEIRLQEARRLILDGVHESISDVAYEVGFEHLSHFSASYKERFGEAASAQSRKAEV